VIDLAVSSAMSCNINRRKGTGPGRSPPSRPRSLVEHSDHKSKMTNFFNGASPFSMGPTSFVFTSGPVFFRGSVFRFGCKDGASLVDLLSSAKRWVNLEAVSQPARLMGGYRVLLYFVLYIFLAWVRVVTQPSRARAMSSDERRQRGERAASPPPIKRP
jgi:hypothetical protein